MAVTRQLTAFARHRAGGVVAENARDSKRRSPPRFSHTGSLGTGFEMNPPRAHLYAWAVVAMLFLVALLNYLDRMMLATMRTSIRADIPTIANDADFGFLMALFMWVYAFLSPVGGYLADRFNRRWMVILSLFIWSLMTWLTGHAHNFSEMAWTRALMGVSEAFYIP